MRILKIEEILTNKNIKFKVNKDSYHEIIAIILKRLKLPKCKDYNGKQYGILVENTSELNNIRILNRSQYDELMDIEEVQLLDDCNYFEYNVKG